MRHILRGLRDHPGLLTAVVLTVASALAGIDRGWDVALGGAAIMGLVVWPPVLLSAWERGRG